MKRMRDRLEKGSARPSRIFPAAAMVIGAAGLLIAMPASAQHRETIRNDMTECVAGSGPAFKVHVDGIKSATGTLRIQTYHATKSEWMVKGKWLNRIEVPARKGSMTFCLPLPASGSYGVAVRHDVNGNGKTDLRQDGGAMSNNPSINIFNLGKPSHDKVSVHVGHDAKTIRIQMRYM